jgi:hypothetical protein
VAINSQATVTFVFFYVIVIFLVGRGIESRLSLRIDSATKDVNPLQDFLAMFRGHASAINTPVKITIHPF